MKVCPLCKKSYIRIIEEGIARKEENRFWFIEQPEFIIQCANCGCERRSWSLEKAKEEWNNGEVSDWERKWWSLREKKHPE